MRISYFQESFWKDHGTFGEYVGIDVNHNSVKAELISGWSFSNTAQSRRLHESSARLLAEPRAGTYSDGETAAIEFEYAESLIGKSFALTLSFAKSRDPRVSAIPSETLTINAEPDNNHYVDNYSS